MTNSLNGPSARLLGVIAILLPVLTLGGCGQQGPLYLPGNPSEIKTEVPKQDSGRGIRPESGPEMPASEQQDEDDDEDNEEQPE
jgi:predicted small lipoprotein YifL